MRHHEQRPDKRQLEDLRAQLHGIVDRVVDGYPTIDRQAREMTRGFAGGGPGGGVASGGVSDPTTRAALSDNADPAQRAEDWLDDFDKFDELGKGLDSRLRKMLPVDPKSLDRVRINVEICPECGQPVVHGGKRLDGDLYHNGGDNSTDPACWWKAYNRKRGRRPSASELDAAAEIVDTSGTEWTEGRHLGAAQFEERKDAS